MACDRGAAVPGGRVRACVPSAAAAAAELFPVFFDGWRNRRRRRLGCSCPGRGLVVVPRGAEPLRQLGGAGFFGSGRGSGDRGGGRPSSCCFWSRCWRCCCRVFPGGREAFPRRRRRAEPLFEALWPVLRRSGDKRRRMKRKKRIPALKNTNLQRLFLISAPLSPPSTSHRTTVELPSYEAPRAGKNPILHGARLRGRE